MNKFEKLIEYIINDEDQKARELFHDIVVEKSRDIYESIMDEEQVEENVHGDQVGDMVDEIGHEESVGEDEEEFAGAGEEELGGDEDLGGEEPAEFGDEEGSAEEHGEIEDKVMNIDAKLDELLAKFDEIMGDEGHGEEVPAEEPGMDMGAEVGAEEEPAMFEAEGSGKSGSAMSGKSGKSGSGVAEAFGKSGSALSGKSGKSGSGSAKSGKSGKPFEGKQSTSEIMREYVDKIQDMNLTGASEGDAVGGAGKKTSVNTKSITGPGADFGGTANMAKGGVQDQDGTTPTKASNEYTKGQGEIKSGNRNVPGGKADKLEGTGKEYAKAGDAEGKTVGNDGTVPVNSKSVQKQNTGKK